MNYNKIKPGIIPAIALTLAFLGAFTSAVHIRITPIFQGQLVSFLLWGLSGVAWAIYAEKLDNMAEKNKRYLGATPILFSLLISAAFAAGILYWLTLGGMTHSYILIAGTKIIMTLSCLYAIRVPFYWQEVEGTFRV